MDARTMLESKYLRSAQFGVDMPAEPIFTVAGIDSTTEQGDTGADERWWLIRFKEIAKPLKLIPTNVRCLIACWGSETNAWVGKRVQFFAMPGNWFGEQGTAVRIKAAEMPQALSVQVKMRAKKGEKRKLTYEIAALPPAGTAKPAAQATAAAAAAVTLDPAVAVIFKKSPLYGKPLGELDVAQLRELEALGKTAAGDARLGPEQRARLEVALKAIAGRLAKLTAATPPAEGAGPPASEPAKRGAGLTPLQALIDGLTEAGIPYQGDKLDSDRDYFEGKAAELAAHLATEKKTPAAPSVPTLPGMDGNGKAAEAGGDPIVTFGEKRGAAIKSLDGIELSEYIALGEQKCAALPAEKRAPIRHCIDALVADKARREAAFLGDSPSADEPGSSG